MAKRNEFTRPAAPPGPLFINQPERDLHKQIVTEVAERVINQPILYYAIDVEATDFIRFMERQLLNLFYRRLK